MKEQDQVAALAELDGIELDISPYNWRWRYKDCSWNAFDLPDYLTSRDAIIPLIQKQPRKIIAAMEDHFEEHMKDWLWLKLTPSQLTEALLRATGKWKE